MAASGNKNAQIVQEALCYQVAKIIGEMAVVLEGIVDAILLTGGLAFSNTIISKIIRRVEFLAPIHIYPGEDELKALAMNALLIASGALDAKEYTIS